MQGEMQEGIHLTAFRCPFLLQGLVRMGQQSVVFGMARGQFGRGDFSPHQRLLGTVFLPGAAEELADLIAARIEHGQTVLEMK